MTTQDHSNRRASARSAIVWVGRILALAGLALHLSVPPQRLVLLGPTQRVVTMNSKIGVHTRLTDEVEEWKIQRTLEMVREMGAPWIVEYFPWAYAEPREGHYDWAHADMVVEHALAQGLTVIARIDYVPEWARPEGTTPRYIAEDDYPRYARYVTAFAEHFEGKVSHIIIWNEPNLAFEWGYRPPDPAGYAELLCQSYRAVKEAAPATQVLAAGLAPTLAPPGDEFGLDDRLYLQALYDEGSGACFDGLAMHAYGYTFAADDPPSPDRVNFRRVELLREVMVANGDGEKPAYITEGGWNDHPRWTRSVSSLQRIRYTVDAYERARLSWDWCEAVCLWAFRFPVAQRTYQDRFTFVTPDLIPRPIYTELARYAHGEPLEYLVQEP
ncbi:MAG: hypothetical protein GXX94_01640 [Chloroflexi bacterium]|nr:hypothetical protein [Chloroflexota bacterium]